MMRAISLWQPWASLAMLKQKFFETRSWMPNELGPVLIHAATRWTRAQRELCQEHPFFEALGPNELPLGAILGVATLHAVWRMDYLFYSDALRYGIAEPGKIPAWAFGNHGKGAPPAPGFWNEIRLDRTIVPDARDKGIRAARHALYLRALNENPGENFPAVASTWNPLAIREYAFGDWTRPDRYAWMFTHVSMFAEPIPYKGRQGFFNVDGADVARLIATERPEVRRVSA